MFEGEGMYYQWRGRRTELPAPPEWWWAAAAFIADSENWARVLENLLSWASQKTWKPLVRREVLRSHPSKKQSPLCQLPLGHTRLNYWDSQKKDLSNSEPKNEWRRWERERKSAASNYDPSNFSLPSHLLLSYLLILSQPLHSPCSVSFIYRNRESYIYLSSFLSARNRCHRTTLLAAEQSLNYLKPPVVSFIPAHSVSQLIAQLPHPCSSWM